MGRQSRHLERNESTVQFDKYYGGWCIWGLRPLHLHSFKKLLPHARHKPEGNSKYGLKTFSTESDKVEDFEARNPNFTCNGMVCTRENISSLSSKDAEKVTAQPRLKRAASVHQFPLSTYIGELSRDHMHSDTEKIVSETKRLAEQDVSDQCDVDDHQLGNELSGKTSVDFFDAFQIDKNLFMKNRRKSDAEVCERVVESRKKLTLSRSDSYPTATKSCNRHGNLTPSKLENKLIDEWPSGSSTGSPFSSSSQSSFTTFSSPSSHQSENLKIRHSRSMLCKLSMDGGGEVSYRRASSLNESERYTQLLGPSKSVRFSNEDGVDLDHNLSDMTKLGKMHSMCEAFHVEQSDSIDLPKVLSKSATLKTENYFHKQSDSELTEDEPGTADTQNTANTNLEDFLPENVMRTNDTIDLTDLPNTLKQLMNLTQDTTGLHNDLNNMLLFYFVNELLYDVYEEYDAYYWPASLGPKCHVHSQPLTEDHVLRNVRKRIHKIQGCIPVASNTETSVMSNDLAISEGWMNLQADEESIGLALEVMIFDELVEELVNV